MGKIYEITNGAKSIARVIVKLFGKKYALVSIPLACGILAYGGVSVYVVSFAVFPIALEVFHEADLPRNYIPAALCFGCSTFAMVAPGAPQIQNAIPSSAVWRRPDRQVWLLVSFSCRCHSRLWAVLL